MNKLKYLLVSGLLVATSAVGLVNFAHAQSAGTATSAGDLDGNLSLVGDSSGFGKEPLENTIALLINVLLGILGIIFLVLIIYAGFLWMTAAGNGDQIDKAKQIMIAAVIGLIILLSAYAISTFVIDQLIQATGSDV
jgi:Zn-dependent protease with chaperone function